jgi:hypothetical protein
MKEHPAGWRPGANRQAANSYPIDHNHDSNDHIDRHHTYAKRATNPNEYHRRLLAEARTNP